MKVILVQQIGDPFEPPETIAICTSLDKAKELFKDLFENLPHTLLREYKSKNIHTGEIYDNLKWPLHPYIKEVETDTII